MKIEDGLKMGLYRSTSAYVAIGNGGLRAPNRSTVEGAIAAYNEAGLFKESQIGELLVPMEML